MATNSYQIILLTGELRGHSCFALKQVLTCFQQDSQKLIERPKKPNRLIGEMAYR